MNRVQRILILAGSTAAFAACGGGGNTSSFGGTTTYGVSGSGGATPAPTATPVPGPVTVTGSVVAIANNGFGSSALQIPLAGAVVVIGPTLVLGATPPPVVPGGDVMATTSANGTYSATVASGPAASLAAQATYDFPLNNLSGVTPPATGYYISVFAAGSDGKSAGAPLPVHAFSGVGAGGVLATQRVTTATADEANFLALVNTDRTTANPLALPIIFDEYAEEAARLHATDEATNSYYCHYDTLDHGPGSRYLALLALGQDNENIGESSGQNVPGSYTTVEAAFMSEAATNGGHYTNIIDSTHAWAGVSTIVAGPTAQYVDQEFVSPHGTNPYVYPNFSGSNCPPGVVPNNS
jgi:uncharacterized protein YkwD